MINLLHNMSAYQLALFLAVIFVGFSWLGAIFIRPILNIWVRGQPNRNALVGFTISSFSVFYGLLLGLLSVATYNNSQEVENTVKAEATTLATLYRDVSHYPGNVKYYFQDQIKNYILYTVEEVWPAQQQGKRAKYDKIIVSSIQENLMIFEPTSKAEEILHAETMRTFNAFIEARQLRQAGADKQIPLALWYVVGMGALLSIVLYWLFDMKFSMHFLLGGTLAFFLSMMIFVTLSMDAPLRGELGVPPEAFQNILDHLIQTR